MGYWVAAVDDDRANLKAADRILSFNGFRVSCMLSGEELLGFLEDNRPDIVLLDVHMPGIGGFETLERLRMLKNGRDLPVIFVTADTDADTEIKALAAGAADFVQKPYIPVVLLMRVKNNIELFRLQKDLKSEVSRVTSQVMKEHERNERLSIQIVQTLAGTIDAKDSYTRGHSSRVAEYARLIARRAGYSERAQEDIYMMGLLHDVGKIGIPDAVINKPTKLTDEEYELIKTHPMKGFDILKNITELPGLAVGARWHHERYDGKGYPDGLKGTDIPEEARIIAVADAYDAMSSRRSYHDVFGQLYIAGEIRKGSGTQFDPKFAEIMLRLIEEDKDFLMRERENTGRDEESEADEEQNRKFGFLAMLEVGGLNTPVGMKYCMNDTDFYAEMLQEFVSGADERRDQLERSLDAGDSEKYRVFVHSLKSASKTLGALELSEKARELEEAARDGDMGYVAQEHPELMHQLREAVGGILMALAMK